MSLVAAGQVCLDEDNFRFTTSGHLYQRRGDDHPTFRREELDRLSLIKPYCCGVMSKSSPHRRLLSGQFAP